MGSVKDISKSPGVKLHEATYAHGNLPSTAEKAKLPYITEVTSDIQTQIDGIGLGLDTTFGAGMLLDFSGTVGNGDVITNQGHWGVDADFYTVGSAWTATDTENVGRYVTKGDANNGGFRHKARFESTSAGASFVSISSTQIVVDSTAVDLQALFQHVGHANLRRKYKIIVRSTAGGNKAHAGYIGEVGKVGNRYTITVYATPDGTSAGWAGYDSGLTSPSYWGIFRACFDFVKGSATRQSGISFGFFYYPTDVTGDNIHLFTLWNGFVDANKCQNYALYQTSTNGQLSLIWKDSANSASSFSLTCETANQWHPILCTIGNSEYSASGVNSLSIAGVQLYGMAPDKNPGMLNSCALAIGCAPLGDETNIIPNGSRLAYPTLWDCVIAQDTGQAWARYYMNKLNL